MNVRSEQYAILDRVDGSSISRGDGNPVIILSAVTVGQRKDVGSLEAISFVKIGIDRLFPRDNAPTIPAADAIPKGCNSSTQRNGTGKENGIVDRDGTCYNSASASLHHLV